MEMLKKGGVPPEMLAAQADGGGGGGDSQEGTYIKSCLGIRIVIIYNKVCVNKELEPPWCDTINDLWNK